MQHPIGMVTPVSRHRIPHPSQFVCDNQTTVTRHTNRTYSRGYPQWDTSGGYPQWDTSRGYPQDTFRGTPSGTVTFPVTPNGTHSRVPQWDTIPGTPMGHFPGNPNGKFSAVHSRVPPPPPPPTLGHPRAWLPKQNPHSDVRQLCLKQWDISSLIPGVTRRSMCPRCCLVTTLAWGLRWPLTPPPHHNPPGICHF